jgi:hypothetical protein
MGEREDLSDIGLFRPFEPRVSWGHRKGRQR